MNTVALKTYGRGRGAFFLVMACAVMLAVFAGFSRTFYLRGLFTQTRPMSALLHVHAVVFSAWIGVFLIQTLLIARGSRQLHRRLGWVAVGIASTMVILVGAAVTEELRRVGGFPPPPLALALSAFDVVIFAGLVGAAVWLRNRPDWHKRLMLAATIVLLGAPMFRIVRHLFGISDPGMAGNVSALLVDAFFLPCIAYDLLTRRRVHPAYIIGLTLVVLDQIAQAQVVSWPPWINLAESLQRLVT